MNPLAEHFSDVMAFMTHRIPLGRLTVEAAVANNGNAQWSGSPQYFLDHHMACGCVLSLQTLKLGPPLPTGSDFKLQLSLVQESLAVLHIDTPPDAHTTVHIVCHYGLP